MITDWLAQSGLFALALAVVFVPGLLVGLVLRLRGLVLWASAPGISVGLLSVLAIAYSFLGIRWGHLSVAIGVVIVGALLYALSLLVGRRRLSPPRRRSSVPNLLLFMRPPRRRRAQRGPSDDVRRRSGSDLADE